MHCCAYFNDHKKNKNNKNVHTQYSSIQNTTTIIRKQEIEGKKGKYSLSRQHVCQSPIAVSALLNMYEGKNKSQQHCHPVHGLRM
jgi:hypothetical protein